MLDFERMEVVKERSKIAVENVNCHEMEKFLAQIQTQKRAPIYINAFLRDRRILHYLSILHLLKPTNTYVNGDKFW